MANSLNDTKHQVVVETGSLPKSPQQRIEKLKPSTRRCKILCCCRRRRPSGLNPNQAHWASPIHARYGKKKLDLQSSLGFSRQRGLYFKGMILRMYPPARIKLLVHTIQYNTVLAWRYYLYSYIDKTGTSCWYDITKCVRICKWSCDIIAQTWFHYLPCLQYNNSTSPIIHPHKPSTWI